MARRALLFGSMADCHQEADRCPATEAAPRREMPATSPGIAPYPPPVSWIECVGDHATGPAPLLRNSREALEKELRPLSVVFTSTRAAAVRRRPRTAAANMINGLRGVQERCPCAHRTPFSCKPAIHLIHALSMVLDPWGVNSLHCPRTSLQTRSCPSG